MSTPDWIDRAYDWAEPLPFYKRWYFHLIIVPADEFYIWWNHRVHTPWFNFKNAIMRVKVGYDWSDVWNMNNWFIDGAVGILETLLTSDRTMGGCPMMDDLDGKPLTEESWDAILHEMLEGFKFWQTFEGGGEYLWVAAPPIEVDGEIHESFVNKLFDSEEKSYSCFGKDGAHYMTFDGEWTKCSMTTEEEKKYQRALDLFAKYHSALWD